MCLSCTVRRLTAAPNRVVVDACAHVHTRRKSRDVHGTRLQPIRASPQHHGWHHKYPAHRPLEQITHTVDIATMSCCTSSGRMDDMSMLRHPCRHFQPAGLALQPTDVRKTCHPGATVPRQARPDSLSNGYTVGLNCRWRTACECAPQGHQCTHVLTLMR